MSVLLGNAKGVAIGIQADMWDPAITTNPVGYSGGSISRRRAEKRSASAPRTPAIVPPTRP